MRRLLTRLLQWLLAKLGQQPAPSTPIPREQPLDPRDFELYRPDEMLIFHYWNGSELISEDPMVLHRRIMEVRPDLAIDMKLARSISKDAYIGHTKMLDKIRTIFGVQPWNKEAKTGLTEIATVKLFDQFLIYCEVLKKSMNPSLTSPMETLPSSPSSPEDAPPTENSSDTGSTASESPSATPPPSPTAPE